MEDALFECCLLITYNSKTTQKVYQVYELYERVYIKKQSLL